MFAEGEPVSHGCQRCRREARECVVPTSTKRGGIQNVISGRERRRREHEAREQLAQAAAIKSEGWQTRELYNTTDALSILSHVARSFPKIESQRSDALPDVTPSYDSTSRSTHKDATTISGLGFIAIEHILTPAHARLFGDFFLEKINPVYPGIPLEYRTVDALTKLPLLFGTVCMIASRYYVAYGTDASLRDRSFEIHLRLWIWVRRSLAQHIWSSQLSQSLETVLTNLLLSEWGPVAFELRSEEINRYLAFRGTPSEEWVRKTTLRNSDRTLLLIIGNAVRLAQDAGLDASLTSVNVGLLLSEVVISSRMGRPCMLANIIREPLNPKLNYTVAQQAQAEILQVMAMANDMLYHSREHTRDLLSSGRYLSLLFMFVPHFDNWMTKYADLFRGDASVNVMAILFGAYHIKLYTFSLALSRRGTRAEDTPIMSRECSAEPSAASDKAPAADLNALPRLAASNSKALTWDRQGTQFINIAVDSAKHLIGMATTFFQRGQLAFMPTRWAMYIIHAIVILIKTLIVMPPLKTRDRATETLTLARQAAQLLVNSGPDNYHVCRLYGTVLVNLCAHLTKEISRSQEASRSTTPTPQARSAEDQQKIGSDGVGTPGSTAAAAQAAADSDPGSNSSAAPSAMTPFSPHDSKISPETLHSPQLASVPIKSGVPMGASHSPPVPPGATPTGLVGRAQISPPMVGAGYQQVPHHFQSPVGSGIAHPENMHVPNGRPGGSATSPLHASHPSAPPQRDIEYQMGPDMQLAPNVDFDFMMTGGDGLGFVEPFLETLSKGDFFDAYCD